MTLSFQPQLLSKYESGSNTCLEFILITCRVRRWLNLLGEITQRCYKIIQMSHQTRQWQLHTTLTECSVPDLTLWRLGKSWHIFFFFLNCLLTLLVSVSWVDGWNKGRRGGGSPEAQASGVNRCVGSLPFWNGSSSRCTAAGCGSQIHPAARPVLKYWVPGKEEEAGWEGGRGGLGGVPA